MKGAAKDIMSALFGPVIPQWLRRQKARAAKRESKHAAFHVDGLNGKRAVARRLRHIERGHLRVTA